MVLLALATAVVSGLDALGILVLFSRAPRIAGFTASEVLFLYGTSAFSFTISDVLLGTTEQLGEGVRRGTLDAVLVRPVSPLIQIATEGFSPRRLGKLVPAGILTASSAGLRVCGLDPSRRRTALARRIGVVFGQRTTLWWDLPLRDSLALVRRLYRVDAAAHRARLAELTALLGLEPFLHIPVRQLSLGQRMRGDLAAALLHDPELLVPDEPTIGLDVVSKATVRDFLERVNAERGTTILLTTHDLGDIERLCRRVMIVDRGRLAYDGGLDELRRTVDADRTLVVELAEPATPIVLDGAEADRVEGARQRLRVPRGRNAAALIAALAQRYEVRDISPREAGIEDVLAGLYRGDHAYWCSGRPVAP